jgi:hypothetical protein
MRVALVAYVAYVAHIAYYSHIFRLYYYTFSFRISHQRNIGHTNLAVLVFATLNNIMLIKAILKLMSFVAYNFVPNSVANSPISTNNLMPYFQKPNVYLYIYIYTHIYIYIKIYGFCDMNFRSVIKRRLYVCVYCCTFKSYG